MVDRLAPLSKDVLADLVSRGLTDVEIAAVAGVRPRSLQNRRLKFGLLRPHASGPEWTEAQDRELRRLFRSGQTDREIAQPGAHGTEFRLQPALQHWSDPP